MISPKHGEKFHDDTNLKYIDDIAAKTQWYLKVSYKTIFNSFILSVTMWKLYCNKVQVFTKTGETDLATLTHYLEKKHLTHWGRMTHKCVNKLGHHLFR